jgi:hypothetical protein
VTFIVDENVNRSCMLAHGVLVTDGLDSNSGALLISWSDGQSVNEVVGRIVIGWTPVVEAIKHKRQL